MLFREKRKKKYPTIRTVPKSIPLTRIYMTAHFLGLVQALQLKIMRFE
jgi:hypothetical protein